MQKYKLAVICIIVAILASGVNVSAVKDSNGENFATEQVIERIQKDNFITDENIITVQENEIKNSENAGDEAKVGETVALFGAEETEVFSLNLNDITDRTGGAYAPKGTSAGYYNETENERQYINIAPTNGTITFSTQYAKKLITDGYIDFSVRTKDISEKAYISMQCGTSQISDLIKFSDGHWSVHGNNNIENSGNWMEFRILLKINDSGVYERKTLLKNLNGVYEEVTGWEVTNLSVIQSARFTVGYMSLDVSDWKAVTADVDGLYPKILNIEKTDSNSAKITFSRKMDEECMKAEMVKISGNTVTGFTYDEEENVITIKTEKEIVTDDIMFRMGMRADNGMPLAERISNTSLEIKGASIEDGAEVSVKAGKIEITVTQKLNSETVNEETVLLEGDVEYSVSYDEEKDKIIIEYDKLTDSYDYRVIIGRGVVSVDGDFLLGEYILNFTAIKIPFTVKSSSIQNNASVGVGANKIEIYFSNKLDVKTLTEDNITLKKANGEAIKGVYTIDYDVTENKVTVKYGNLDINTGYNLKLSNKITDIEGASLTPYIVNFKTGNVSVYDYPISSESESETHILMTDEEVPYMNLKSVLYYRPSVKETTTLDLEIRVAKNEDFKMSYANFTRSDGTKGTGQKVYNHSGGEFVFNGNPEIYINDGEWKTFKVVTDKDGRDSFLQVVYMMNKEGLFDKVGEIQTEMKDFNYTTYAGIDFDVRKMTYNSFSDSYWNPEILKTEYTKDDIKIYFSADMKNECFTSETVKAIDSTGEKIENIQIEYVEELRMLKVVADGISEIELSEKISTVNNMPIGDVSESVEKIEFSVSNIGLTDGIGGNYITSLSEVDMVSGSAFIINASETDIDVTLFAIMCDKNNMIKKVAHQKETIASGEKLYMNNAVIEDINAEEGDFVKVFLWKSAMPEENPSPVTEFVKIGY